MCATSQTESDHSTKHLCEKAFAFSDVIGGLHASSYAPFFGLSHHVPEKGEASRVKITLGEFSHLAHAMKAQVKSDSHETS